MAGELRLEYLGGMQITRGGTPQTGFVSVKAPALLCYLAVTGRPQFRLALAGLLWGDLPETDACANLRKVLSNLRDLVGDHLIITPHTVTFNRQGAYWLDVEAFLKRVDKETGRQGTPDHPLVSLSTSPLSTCLPLLEAADLYKGDFLDGFYVRHALAFEEWVLGQRERLRQVASHVFQAMATYYVEQRDQVAALDYTSRLLTLDPWREEAHRQMMTLLAHSGQRSAALAQYETCRRLLKSELNIEPAAETTALYRRIRAMGSPRPHNLPAAITSFVGREAELAQLARELADPARRLLTIFGPGGVGKTRLGLQAASDAKERGDDAFLDGVYFIPLETVSSRQTLASALALAVGLRVSPGLDPELELSRFLQDKDLLLVLDGFEHLVGEASLLSTILRHAPQVKLLVTSRQRLDLAGEWPLRLYGLPYPPLGAVEGLETFAAIGLFLQRARLVCPYLRLSSMDYQAISYICELVEGLPLAIELAAAWAKTLCCLDIARAIESGLDMLTAFLRDTPPRHRSIRTAFEHSWNLLSPAERLAFRCLAVFCGGFDQQAASEVADVALPLLTALTDKSLLRRDPNERRFAMHELLRQFAREKLAEAPVESREATDRHAWLYLAEFLPQREAELRGGRQREALQCFRKEIGNVQAAWAWAAEHGMVDAVGRGMLPLAILYEMLGWWREGEAAFGAAAAELDARLTDSGGEAGVTLGAVLAMHGTFCARIGKTALAHTQLQVSLAWLQPIQDDRKEKAFPHLGLGLLACIEGRPADAEDHYLRGLRTLRAANDPLLTAFALDYLGTICANLGKLDEARLLLEEALALHRAHDEQWGIGRALLGLGQIAARLGEPAEARQRLTESMTTFEAVGGGVAAARARSALGEVACATGELTLAHHLLETSLPVLEEAQNPALIVRCQMALGRVNEQSCRQDGALA